MEKTIKDFGRRNFIKKTATFTTALTGIVLFPQTVFAIDTTAEDDINIVGPKEGFSPQIGTLVSMMNWMRMVALSRTIRLPA